MSGYFSLYRKMPAMILSVISTSALLVLLGMACFTECHAQDTAGSAPFVQFSGSVTVTADFYSHTATPDSAQEGRRMPTVFRVLFTPNLKFGELISIPFNIRLTTPETKTLLPSIPKPTLSQFFQNPANSFGFSSVTPKIGWAQFSLGSHTPVYSAMSAGDQQLFGLGFDLKPGGFRIAASGGVAQGAVEPDTAKNIKGAYRRDMYMGRLAFGKEEGTIIGVNLIRVKDAAGSLKNNIVSITPAHSVLAFPSDSTQPPDTVRLPADTVRLRAEEGFVATTDLNVAISEDVSAGAEFALSSFTRDQSSAEKQIDGNPLGSVQTTRTSTRADYAGSAFVGIKNKTWGLKLKGLYMGAGFVPVGYPFTQADKLDITVSPSLHLFDNKFSVDGSIGQRTNNLSKTKGETTTQLIASANLSADFSDAFNLSAQYSNFGVRNDQTLDSLKVQNVSQSLSIDPTLTLESDAMTHVITASFGIDTYKDYNVVTGAESNNDTRTALASYSASLSGIPLRVGLLASYMENRLPGGALIIRSISTTAGYSLFDKKVTPTLTVTAQGSTLGAAKTDAQIFFKFGVGWRPGKFLDLKLDAGNNSYTYGNPIPKGSAFSETLIQLSATTQF